MGQVGFFIPNDLIILWLGPAYFSLGLEVFWMFICLSFVLWLEINEIFYYEY